MTLTCFRRLSRVTIDDGHGGSEKQEPPKEENMIYIGIDPGQSGALAWINDSGMADVFPFSDIGYLNFCFRCKGKPAVAAVEKVGAMPGQGVTSMFKFGENYGWIQGILKAHLIPYELVTPQKWKKEFSVTSDKNTSIEVCKRLFPDVNLKRTEKCKKDHDGMAEALLIAEYARRHMK